MSEEDKEPLSLEPQPQVKFLQTLKVIGRTVSCYKCVQEKKKDNDGIATVYCPCGAFLCFLHTVSHSCLVLSSMSYSDDLVESFL
jgi:hypothetical protein